MSRVTQYRIVLTVSTLAIIGIIIYECCQFHSLHDILETLAAGVFVASSITYIITEAWIMIARYLLDKADKEREEVRREDERTIAKILESRNLTKDDIPQLRHLLSTGEDS